VGEAVIPLLIDALRSEAIAVADQLSASTPANAHGTNPPACYAGLALSAIGQPAVLPLVELLQHDHWCVRVMAADTLSNIGLPAQEAIPALTERLRDKHARVRRQSAEALGRLGAAAASAVPALIERVRDTDVHVRHNVALALAKIGRPANEAIPLLLQSLEDEDRYVRYYAAVALRHIPTPEAQKAIFDALFTARWCPLTTQESLF
jgi:HEAT repeat protein